MFSFCLFFAFILASPSSIKKKWSIFCFFSFPRSLDICFPLTYWTTLKFIYSNWYDYLFCALSGLCVPMGYHGLLCDWLFGLPVYGSILCVECCVCSKMRIIMQQRMVREPTLEYSRTTTIYFLFFPSFLLTFLPSRSPYWVHLSCSCFQFDFHS